MIKTSLKILFIFIIVFFLQSCSVAEWIDFYLDPSWECRFTGQRFDDREECERHCDEGCVGHISR